jgi:hypothetical protein
MLEIKIDLRLPGHGDPVHGADACTGNGSNFVRAS